MKITLKQKKLADGMMSLYVDYYKGSSTNLQGKRIHLRDFEYLKKELAVIGNGIHGGIQSGEHVEGCLGLDARHPGNGSNQFIRQVTLFA